MLVRAEGRKWVIGFVHNKLYAYFTIYFMYNAFTSFVLIIFQLNISDQRISAFFQWIVISMKVIYE